MEWFLSLFTMERSLWALGGYIIGVYVAVPFDRTFEEWEDIARRIIKLAMDRREKSAAAAAAKALEVANARAAELKEIATAARVAAEVANLAASEAAAKEDAVAAVKALAKAADLADTAPLMQFVIDLDDTANIKGVIDSVTTAAAEAAAAAAAKEDAIAAVKAAAEAANQAKLAEDAEATYTLAVQAAEQASIKFRLLNDVVTTTFAANKLCRAAEKSNINAECAKLDAETTKAQDAIDYEVKARKTAETLNAARDDALAAMRAARRAAAEELSKLDFVQEVSFFDEYYLDLFSNQYAQTYFGLVLYVFLALALCGLLATLAYLLSLSTSQDTEKRSEYECGFAPFDSATRLPFDVHFYLVGILFLIFDVEVALLFPWVLSLNTIGWFGFYLMIIFLLVLSVGFLYEWKRGALIWPARYTALQSGLSEGKWFVSVSAVFSSNLLELARIENFSLTFTDFFLSEILLAAGVIYLLTAVALELGEGRSKVALSPESLVVMHTCLAAVGVLLGYQLLAGLIAAPVLNGYFAVGCGADLMKLLTGVSTLFVLGASKKYLKEHYQHTVEYPIMIALSLWFLLLLVQANHLISTFLCIVGFSLNLYVLVLYDIAARPSREAGLKYYYLSTLSSGLILYGAFLLYALSGSGEFDELYTFFLRDGLRYSELTRSAVMLTIFGIFFKLSAVPAHLWAVEVYEGSPSPITALFMLPVKVAMFAIFIRLLALGLSGLSHFWSAILLLVVSASLLWGALAATYERNTKRFLGYASINQIGYLLLGLGCGADSALRSSMSYLVVYVLMSAAFLLIFIWARRADHFNLNYTSDFRGLAKQEWLVSWTLAIVLFSMAGIPPLSGFYAKYAVLVSAMAQSLYAPTVVALATSLLGAFYYLRFIRAFWFEDTSSVAPVLCDMSRVQRIGLSFIEILLWSGALIGPALLPFMGHAVDSLLSLSLVISRTHNAATFAPPYRF